MHYICRMRSLLLLVTTVSVLHAGESTLKVKPGDLAPRFMLPKLDDDRQRLALSQFVDSAKCSRQKSCKPVVMAFWSTSCVPCRKELPRLQAWASQRPDVVFWPILVDATTESTKGLQWLESVGVASKGLQDPYQAVGSRYGVCEHSLCNVPALVAIGSDGRVKVAHQGYSEASPLEQELNKALPQGK